MRWKKRRNLDLDFEVEEDLLPLLCDKKKIAVDVGAADGRYTIKLQACCAGVVAFEPNPSAALKLRSLFRGNPRVRVEEAALSDGDGDAILFTPAKSFKLGTIEANNWPIISRAVATHIVHCRRLDSFALPPVGFIKIDVEGHELSVLKGASDTISRERPILLVEVEERHNSGSFSRVVAFMRTKGYSGFFVQRKVLLSVNAFSVSVHQNVSSDVLLDIKEGRYIHNFLFIPNPGLNVVNKIRGGLR